MKDRDTNGDTGGIDSKEHTQLVQDVPRTRFGIGPKTIPGEVVDHGTQEGNCACIYQPHGEEAGKKIHDSEIKDRANCSNGGKLEKAGAFFIVVEDHTSPNFFLKYGMVLWMPSSRETFGSHFNISRARVISG